MAAEDGLAPSFGFRSLTSFAFGAAVPEMVAFEGGDTGGIIAAVFKTLERIHQLLRDRSASENAADNAAHAV